MSPGGTSMGKAFSDVGVGNGTPMCSRFSLVRRNLLKIPATPGIPRGDRRIQTVFGRHPLEALVRQGFGDRRSAVRSSVPGSSMVRTVATSRCWASSAKMVSGSPPARLVRCPGPQPGTQVATLSKEPKPVRSTPRKPAGSVAKISRGSRIHTPIAASSTRKRGWSCTRRFRRNQRSVRMYLFRLHARASHRPPS